MVQKCGSFLLYLLVYTSIYVLYSENKNLEQNQKVAHKGILRQGAIFQKYFNFDANFFN